jgi:HD-GYP domain-containing protein (c-di-GMP phosphodiesterase class II)
MGVGVRCVPAAALIFVVMAEPAAHFRVRLAELLAVLSLAADLGMGQPMEHVLRQCLISLRLAQRLGMDEAGREVVYYAALLAWVGCHVDAYEQAKWFGDETALKADFRQVDFGTPVAGPMFLLRHLGAGRPVPERARLGVAFLGDGRRAAEAMLENHWLAADNLAARLGLNQRVRDSVEQTFERWDGKGVPKGAKGEEILLSSRLVTLADVVEVFHRAGGTDAAVAVARQRRGTQFDPQVVDVFAAEAESLFAGLDETSSWGAVIEAEPALAVPLTDAELGAALEAIADFTDVKSPYTIGHSRGVAGLAGEAARTLGLDGRAVTLVRRAGLVHDLGRLGVPNTIWDKPGRLSQAETERVRLHPYLTERMLAGSPALAPLAAIAVQHHERLDGSGYPRGLSGSAVSPEGRVLAAADFYQSRTEPRPHRPASTAGEAATQMRAEVRAGRMDGEAAAAVLAAAGHRPARRQTRAAGLTAREVEVLRLLARGLSNKEIAERLVISRKTASHHVEHIYTKTGTSNRALASLFAANHGLIGAADPGPADGAAWLRRGHRLVAGAQDPHPADAPAIGAVVGLLLHQVIAAGPAHAYPVGDVLAFQHPAGGDRAQLQDVVPGAEPVPEDDLLDHLPAVAGLPVAPGGQGLEVDRAGQQRAHRGAVLGGQSPREALTGGGCRAVPASGPLSS